MNPALVIFLVGVAIMLLTLLFMVVWTWLDGRLEKRRYEHFKEGYRTAVDDILKGGCYIDHEAKMIKPVSIASIDGEFTEYWEEKFEKYTTAGVNAVIDSFVEHGVMSKRTGDKFKYRYVEKRKAKKEEGEMKNGMR